jgi:hypothetical protein
MKNLLQQYKPYILALLIVIGVSLAARIAMAKSPSLKQQAVKELPTVIEEIEYTDPFVERNTKAKDRRTQLLQCIDGGDCSFLAEVTPAQ